MKIGTITFHSAHNYGAVLQAYALKEYLSKKGYDVSVINYKLKEIENFYRLDRYKKSKNKIINCFRKYSKKISLYTTGRPLLKRKDKFDEFINTKLNITNPYYTLKELQRANLDFDVLICGSDQIWNRKHTKSLKPAFFLEFGKKDAKRISYAASIGAESIIKEDEMVFQRYLKNLDEISVREKKAIELIQHLTPKKIEEVVDPTQLLEKEDYEKIQINPEIKKDYILVHSIGQPEELIKVVREVSERLKLPVMHNLKKGTFKREFGYSGYSGPGEFLGNIANAKFVITNSFHATSFALIYSKPFITMPFKDRSSRMINLLHGLGLDNHFVENIDLLKDMEEYEIKDYQKIHDIMKKNREKSEKFLINAIETPKKEINDNYFKSKDKFNCYGCTACASACPKNAITMVEDEDGFIYPKIDEEKCIKCGLCERICIYKNKKLVEQKENKKSYALYSKDEEVRQTSSSGGAFTGLYKYIIGKGGYIVGVKYDENMNPVYDIVNTEQECEKFKGAKYVRANCDKIYLKIKEKLEQDKYVLATGTPCFINGLKSFLGKDYDKLITMDIVCHGTPSPKIFKKYIQELEDKNESKVVNFNFRDKKNGWQTATIKIEFENGKEIYKLLKQNSYGNAFLKSLTYRPCCYNCEFVKGNTVADITVADFWATRVKYQEMDDNKGISLVIIHNQKGEEIFEQIKDNYNVTEIPYEDAFLGNHSRPVDITTERQFIFEEMEEGNISKLLSKYSKLKNQKNSSKNKFNIKKFIPKKVKKTIKKIIKK